MKKDITELFCWVDDFCKSLDRHLSSHQLGPSRQPTRVPEMTLSEMVTILILYHQSPCKNFKYFYLSYLQLYKSEFPSLVSYSRFIQLKPRSLIYLTSFVNWFCHISQRTGIAYMDSSSLAVCHSKRARRHKVFEGVAQLGKSTKGWFMGLKIHLITNEKGQLLSVYFTPGNVDDRVPVKSLTKNLKGYVFADRGYIKKELFEELYQRGLKMVTGLKKSMKPKLMLMFEKMLLRKRGLIESVFHLLKNIFELEHTRHRSVANACVHLTSTLLAYCFKSNKPKIKFDFLIQN
jgi:hypothetical protein